MIKRIIFFCIFCLAVIVSGCGPQQADMADTPGNFAVITDNAGRTVTLATKPERVVVLPMPSAVSSSGVLLSNRPMRSFPNGMRPFPKSDLSITSVPKQSCN